MQDCRLTVSNTSSYRVVVSALLGNARRPLGVLPPASSETFAVPRSVQTVVAEVSNQEYCRGPVRWRTDGTAEFIVGGPSCRLEEARATETLVLAGGCYWGVEAVFEHVRGVTEVVSGFALPEGDRWAAPPAAGADADGRAQQGSGAAVRPGSGGAERSGSAAPARLRHTSYAEALRISFDAAEVSRERLLAVFFEVAHDPTQLDRQGPDVGPEYRSVVFVEDDEGARAAAAYLERLRASGAYEGAIVTEIARLGSFEIAPPDQQDFVARNPTSLYVLVNDLPKLAHLRERFPELYREDADSLVRWRG